MSKLQFLYTNFGKQPSRSSNNSCLLVFTPSCSPLLYKIGLMCDQRDIVEMQNLNLTFKAKSSNTLQALSCSLGLFIQEEPSSHRVKTFKQSDDKVHETRNWCLLPTASMKLLVIGVNKLCSDPPGLASDNWKSRWHLACTFISDAKPEPRSQVSPRFLAQRNYEW